MKALARSPLMLLPSFRVPLPCCALLLLLLTLGRVLVAELVVLLLSLLLAGLDSAGDPLPLPQCIPRVAAWKASTSCSSCSACSGKG